MEVVARTDADRATLMWAMNVSLAVGLIMFVMKVGAYLLTGSAAILSDAAEVIIAEVKSSSRGSAWGCSA